MRHIYITLALVLTGGAFAIEPSQVAWQLPLDFRAPGSPTSESGITGLHILPSGNIAAISERFLGPTGVFVTAISGQGSSIRTTTMTSVEPPQAYPAYRTGSGIDQFGRLYLSLNLSSSYHFFRLSPDAQVQTTVPNVKGISAVDDSGYSYYALRDFVYEKRSPGGGLVFRRPSALGLQGSSQVLFLRRTTDGGAVLTGSILAPTGQSILRKFDSAGNQVFERIILTTQSEQVQGTEVNGAGDIYVLSSRQSVGDTRVTKFRSTDGVQLWQRTVPRISMMAINGDGILAMTTFNPSGFPTLLRMSPSGGLYPEVPLPGAALGSYAHLEVDAYNEIYTHGNALDGRVYVTKHAPNGSVRFTQYAENPNGALTRDLVRVDSASGQILVATRLTPIGEEPFGNLVGIHQTPVPKPDSFTVPANQQSMPGSFMANDQYARGAGIVISRLPSHGTLTWGPSGVFKYTPDSGFTGADSFTYRLTRGSLSSFSTTVSLNVQ